VGGWEKFQNKTKKTKTKLGVGWGENKVAKKLRLGLKKG
jgi:hypothetical protein